MLLEVTEGPESGKKKKKIPEDVGFESGFETWNALGERKVAKIQGWMWQGV